MEKYQLQIYPHLIFVSDIERKCKKKKATIQRARERRKSNTHKRGKVEISKAKDRNTNSSLKYKG